MPNFTTEDLLVYLYNEMEAKKACEVEAALQTDWALRQKYEVLCEAQSRLKTTPLYAPRSSSVASILQYAEMSLHLSN